MYKAALWREKRWGRVLHILGVSCLDVRAGYQCSRHYHEHKSEEFGVVSGSLLILEWEKNAIALSLQTIINPGEFHTVDANVDHRFCVIESGMVVERYVANNGQPVRTDDIYRLDKGGLIPQGELGHLQRQKA